MTAPPSADTGIEDLRAIVAEMVDVPAETIGLDDDLTLLGMDSLRMMRVLTRLRAAGRSMRFSAMTQAPTIASWWAMAVPDPGGQRSVARNGHGPDGGRPATAGGDERFELTAVQHAYWMGRESGLSLGGVGSQYYVELDGTGVNPARLRSSMLALMIRHPMLRCAFHEDGTQQILDRSPWPGLRLYDDTGCPGEELAQRLDRRRDELAHQALRPSEGIVLDVALSLLPGRRTRLHLTIDMLVADADSFRILLGDLEKIYRGASDELPALHYGFADYVRDWRPLALAASDEARSYWMSRIGDLPRAPVLPTVPMDGVSTDSRRINRRHWHLPAQETSVLEQTARRHGLSLATVMMTAFAETVAAWSDQPRFLLNIPFYLREQLHDEVPFVVGDFTNLMLLDCDLSGTRSFLAQAQRLQRQLYQDADHIAYSGVNLLRDLTKEWGEPALAPIVFTSGLSIGDLYSQQVRRTFGDPVWTISQVPQTLLDCQVLEFEGGVLVNWDCVDGVFLPGVLDGMFAGFVGLLGWLVGGDWGLVVGSLVPAGVGVVRVGVNGTAGVVPGGVLHEGFFGWAGRDPGRLGVVAGGVAVSYGQLAERALGVCGFLRGRGVVPGDRVGVSLVKGVDQVAVVLGVLAAGCVYVPVAVDQPRERRVRMCRSAGVGVVLADAVSGWDAGMGVVVWSAAEALAAVPVPAGDLVWVDPGETAYVIFTSGSTGDPKGVMVSHRSARNTVVEVCERFGVGGSDRVLAVSGLDFDLSVFDLFGTLDVGGVVVLPAEEDRRDAAALVGLCQRAGVTVWNSVPALLEMAVVSVGDGLLPAALRLLLVSGDWVRPELATAALDRRPGARFVAMGGATEAAIWSNFYEVHAAPPVGWVSVPYGWPLRNQQFRVVDERGRDCPDWVAGELWIGGLGVAQGYAGDPTLTRAKFVDHDGQRWYRTGDMGRYHPGGILEILGRRDGQVKIRGHRIELGEVETALHACPDIDAAIAVVTTGPNPLLAAFVTTHPTTNPTDPAEQETAWQNQLANHLPPHMIPRHITILDTLPLTRNGKIDRTTLTQWTHHHQPDHQHTPPTTPTEHLIATTWAQTLGHPTISRHHNFFTLGGDSITATRVVARLIELGLAAASLRSLFAHPTVATFAAYLDAAAREADQSRQPAGVTAGITAAPEQRHLPFPLTEVQRAYRLGRQDAFILGGVGSQSYWELESARLDPVRLERALAAVIARHDMLRAVCTGDDSQVVLPEVPRYRIDVTSVDASGFDGAVERMRRDMEQTDLDSTVWPPFEIRMVSSGERTRLGMSLDHTIFDARSAMIFLVELGNLYEDPETTLRPIEVSFRDYVLSSSPSAAELESAERFWRSRLPELPSAPSLPLSRDLVSVQAPRFSRREHRIPKAQWEAISERARAHGCSASSVLAAAYAETVSAWSEGRDLLFMCTTFDRRPLHPDIDDVVGDFTALTLVPYESGAGRSWLETVRGLQQQLWTAMDHRAMSGLAVLRELAVHQGVPFVPVPVVFTSALGMQDASLPLGGPLGRYCHGHSQTPQTLLDCQVLEFEGGVLVNWDCVDGVFLPGVLDGMFAGFVGLLGWLVGGDWGLVVGSLVPAGVGVVRVGVNGTAGVVPGGVLHEGFFGWAGRDPGRLGVVAGGVAVSYGQLAERALGVCGFLRGRGVVPGDRVGVSLVKGVDQVAVVLGVLAAGCVYVPVAVDQPRERRVRMCRSAGVGVVLADAVSGWDAGMGVVVWSAAEALAAVPVPAGDLVWVDPGETAYVIFTSGSTGDPKGVMVSHRSARNTVVEVCERFGVGGSDRVLAVSGLDFDLSVFDLFGTLDVGGVVVLPAEEDRRDAAALVGLCQRAGVTVWNSVPALLEMAVVSVGDGLLPAALRLLLVSGDWVRPELATAALDRRPGARFVAMGGATEAAIWSNFYEVHAAPPVGWVSVPYGWPLRNQQFRVVDERGRDCPDWVAGELWIGGLGVAQGYAGDPTLTRAKFVDHDGQRWYRTGDMGRYHPGGILEILGRRDGQVKIRGHRIELGEVETALHACPDIDAAIAVVTTGPNPLLAAFVTTHPTTNPTDPAEQETAWQNQLANHLPPHMIPRHITILDTLPLTRNGKIDRTTLTQWTHHHQPDHQHTPPTTPTEHLIATTWAQTLGHPTISRHHNFFTLGGDSITATATVAAIQRHTGVTLTLRQIYEHPTVAGIGLLVQERLVGAELAAMEEGVV
jgi:yersiniabactin nonribosomal peptide synthetase